MPTFTMHNTLDALFPGSLLHHNTPNSTSSNKVMTRMLRIVLPLFLDHEKYILFPLKQLKHYRHFHFSSCQDRETATLKTQTDHFVIAGDQTAQRPLALRIQTGSGTVVKQSARTLDHRVTTHRYCKGKVRLCYVIIR